MRFEDFGLPDVIMRAINDMGYETPTPIQEKAIPLVLRGRDVIGSAQTGTGKTAAFALPALAVLEKPERLPRALILEPTRELAAQVAENLDSYGKYMDLHFALLHGGVSANPQKDRLKKGADIVVATTGRLIDLLDQGCLQLDRIEYLVLDEVDRMLDMGFIEDVARIVNQCPVRRQTLLFSATIPEAIRRLASWALYKPVEINAGTRHTPAETVEHAIYPVDAIQKYDLLTSLLEKENYKSAIIFTRTKRDADHITDWLEAHDCAVTTMHADRSQRERQEALEGFKSGKFSILVATDIAARGLDIAGVSHVINYNVPENPEDYVHRIGRTGRANHEGEAITLFSPEEYSFLLAIERFIGQPIRRQLLDGFPYRTEPFMGTPTTPALPKRRNRGFAPHH